MAAVGAERFCDSCRKAVHDFSSLTRREAEALIRRNPGGLCARIAYDSTGTVIFRRDPSASAASRLVAISLLGASALAAQTPASSGSCRLEVKVTDVTGAVVPGAAVEVSSDSGPQQPLHVKTGADGTASLEVPAGQSALKVNSPGFEPSAVSNLLCEKEAAVKTEVQLHINPRILMGAMVTTVEPARAAVNTELRFAQAGPPTGASQSLRSFFARIF